MLAQAGDRISRLCIRPEINEKEDDSIRETKTINACLTKAHDQANDQANDGMRQKSLSCPPTAFQNSKIDLFDEVDGIYKIRRDTWDSGLGTL